MKRMYTLVYTVTGIEKFESDHLGIWQNLEQVSEYNLESLSGWNKYVLSFNNKPNGQCEMVLHWIIVSH